MSLSLSEKTRKLIQERMKHGGYATADDAVQAGLASLKRQEAMGDFAPGELDALIAKAEAEFEKGESFDAEEVFAEIRQLEKDFRRRRNGSKR
jgi:Arc/MetJ-type ribon-helix-helix transcriptional regulator